MHVDFEPITVKPQMQQDVWDCGLTCLAMLLGETYDTLRPFVRAKKPDGLSTNQLRSIAKKCGKPLVFRTNVDEEDIGILDLERQDPDTGEWEGHFAFYARDTVYNPAQGTWWMDTDAFCKEHRWRVVGILRRKR